MRTVYLGTSAFAVAVLSALAAGPHRPALVLTRPDRPRGRGRTPAPPPVADAAAALGLPVAQPASVNDADARARIDAAAPDALVVCAYGALIGEPLLSERPILNVHPSLLPRWRGAAPVERAIMAGDAETGVSIMRLTAGLDSGPVALAASEPIAADDTYGTLAPRLQALGARLLIEALDAGLDALRWVEQTEAGVTYAEKITAADRLLAPAAHDAFALARTVRALAPHIGAAVILPGGGERLGVWAASPRAAAPGDPPGGGARLGPEAVLLGCAEATTLALDVVQPAGRRAMDAAAFLRGRRG